MRPSAVLALLVAALAPAYAPTPAHAGALIDQCDARTCKARLTGPELLGEVQKLVAARRFAEAKPMIEALAGVPQYSLEYRFLTGFIAEQTGDYPRAASMFRAILVDDPKQTRVRLELARTLFAMGRAQAADREFRLAAEDRDLPPDVLRTIRLARNVIRSKRAWTLNVDAGFAPDSNINNATGADSITVLFGAIPIPLTLSPDARARSGTGYFATIDSGLKLPVGGGVSLLGDVDVARTDYRERAFDDFSYELAAGAELALGQDLRVRMQAVGADRVYGHRLATRQIGLKGGMEADLSQSGRLGLQLDVRRTTAPFDNSYNGWQSGLYATYERVVARSFVTSAGLFVRRDALRAAAYSSVELGALAGLGGELPLGFNLGLSGSASRALFDAPIPLFSDAPRHDWRFSLRATLGNRAFNWRGFSPTIGISWGRIDSTLPFYANNRTRLRVALARYF